MTQILRPMLIVRSIWLTVVLFSLPLSSKTISLDEAISMGKGQALDSKLLPERLNQINAQFDQALSAYLPRLKAEAVGTFNFPTISFPSQSGPTIQIQPAEVLDAKLSLQQPLINMESISLINSAVLQRKITKASTQNTERNVELRVIQAYLSTLNAQAQIQMQQNRLSRALKQNKWLLGRQKSGQARSTDLARMSAEVDLAHMQLTQAEDSYSAAVTILGLLIGERDNFDLQENTKLPAISCNRPDLKAQKLTVKFAKNQLNATRWSFWPEINLSLQGIYTTNTAGFVNQPLRGAVLLQASWTIFDGYFRFGQLKEKHSKIQEERIKLAYLRDQIHREQAQYEQSVKLKKQALKFSKKQLQTRQNIYKQTEKDLKRGLANTSDLIDASQKLTEAEIDQEKALIALSLSQAQLGYSCQE